MPKLTRDNFLGAIDDLVANAGRNLRNHGHVAPTLIGITARGDQFIALGMPEDAMGQDTDFEARILGKGMHLLPAPFGAHQESMLAFLSGNDCVAAILTDEAYYSTHTIPVSNPNDLAPDLTAPLDEDLSEGVLVIGTWPREFVQRAFLYPIIRDASGRATTGALRPLVGPGAEGDDQTLIGIVEWLSGVLPQPR